MVQTEPPLGACLACGIVGHRQQVCMAVSIGIACRGDRAAVEDLCCGDGAIAAPAEDDVGSPTALYPSTGLGLGDGEVGEPIAVRIA